MALMAAGHDGVTGGVGGHLRAGVIRVGFLGGAAGDEAGPLVVVDLRELHVADTGIIKVPQGVGQERAIRDVVGVKIDHDVVAVHRRVIQPGVDVADFVTGLEFAVGLLIQRLVLTRKVACPQALAEGLDVIAVAFVEHPRLVRVVHRDQAFEGLLEHLEGFSAGTNVGRDSDFPAGAGNHRLGPAHERQQAPAELVDEEEDTEDQGQPPETHRVSSPVIQREPKSEKVGQGRPRHPG